MPCWVKCTRTADGTPIFVNFEQVRTVTRDAPDASTIKFNHGAEVEVEEMPENLVGGFRDASSGTAELSRPADEQLELHKRTLVGRASIRRLPS